MFFPRPSVQLPRCSFRWKLGTETRACQHNFRPGAPATLRPLCFSIYFLQFSPGRVSPRFHDFQKNCSWNCGPHAAGWRIVFGRDFFKRAGAKIWSGTVKMGWGVGGKRPEGTMVGLTSVEIPGLKRIYSFLYILVSRSSLARTFFPVSLIFIFSVSLFFFAEKPEDRRQHRSTCAGVLVLRIHRNPRVSEETDLQGKYSNIVWKLECYSNIGTRV